MQTTFGYLGDFLLHLGLLEEDGKEDKTDNLKPYLKGDKRRNKYKNTGAPVMAYLPRKYTNKDQTKEPKKGRRFWQIGHLSEDLKLMFTTFLFFNATSKFLVDVMSSLFSDYGHPDGEITPQPNIGVEC